MSTMLAMLSAPEYLGCLVSSFHMGMDRALIFYATSPRMAVSLVILLVLFIYYLHEVVKKPLLVGKEGKFKWFLLANCTQLHEHYWPTFWAFGTHAQTALANGIRNMLPNLTYTREYIKLPDGGQVSLDWYDDVLRTKPAGFYNNYRQQLNVPSPLAYLSPSSASNYFFPTTAPPSLNLFHTPSSNHVLQQSSNSGTNCGNSDESKPIAVFIPGLTGDSQTEYIKSLIPYAQSCGYRAVGWNNRGRGGMKLLTPKLYCGANCEDLAIGLRAIRDKYPKAQIVATGVSLGGIILTRYLIEQGKNSSIDAAVLVSVPWDLQAGCSSMEISGLNMALNVHLTKSLVTLVKEHEELLKPLEQIKYDEVIGSRNLREFDERFTIKMWGFNSVIDYYNDASNKGKLDRIRIPTLCINAADDMFCPVEALPLGEVEKSSHVAMVVTQRGGHIGFMEGLVPKLPFYSERLLTQFFDSLTKLSDIRKDLC